MVFNRSWGLVSRPPYRPSLILVPSALIDIWLLEIERHFGDATVRVFYGVKARNGDSERKLLMLEPSLLGHTVILSSYITWAARTTTEVDEDSHPTNRAPSPEIDLLVIDLTVTDALVDEDISEPDDSFEPLPVANTRWEILESTVLGPPSCYRRLDR
ncbi:hypothetical protein N7471_002482 [Penicillium samsonianum]|uniref:uncharacterized protein n=1 Tax=Penicillium samsonianum TaxID=1882272 RepID=UPI002546C69B|nr:uncharacterized protein N7471_002482 [Penicillium samsonianum]KAJ6143029.1 hypothetical protein N7471_002482 [Penicillium samsonianum]